MNAAEHIADKNRRINAPSAISTAPKAQQDKVTYEVNRKANVKAKAAVNVRKKVA